MKTLDLNPYTVLLVEDMEFTRQTVARLLDSMGEPTIETAEDGAQALDILRSPKAIDLVISDFNMPVLNGLELLKAVRSGVAGVPRGMPFAMLTGFSDKHLVDMALALDVNAFLVKPVSKTTLTQRLDKILIRGDDDLWVKSAQIYAETFIEEAEDADETPINTREELVEAYKTMRRESQPEPEPGAPSFDPMQREMTASVMGRLSSLKGKFDESDLARNITGSVDRLVSDTGDKAASRIVSYMDGLIKREVLEIGDLPAVLSPDSGSGVAVASDEPQTATAPVPGEKEDEFFYPVVAIPASTTLSRNLNTADGSLFMVKGTPLTPQTVSILAHLEGLGVLSLETAAGQEGLYVMVGPQAAAPETLPPAVEQAEPPGESPADINEVQPGAVLARDIYTADGRLYMPAGQTLTKRVISMLQDLDSLGHMQSQLWTVN